MEKCYAQYTHLYILLTDLYYTILLALVCWVSISVLASECENMDLASDQV